MIHIDRRKRTEAGTRSPRAGRELFAQGIWVIMFPEGTRTPRGSQGVYKSGASRLAIAGGVPIVPLAASSAKCWPPKSFLLRRGDRRFDRPADHQRGPPAEELMREVETWIEAEMAD